MKQKI
jgi:hypothetical protein